MYYTRAANFFSSFKRFFSSIFANLFSSNVIHSGSIYGDDGGGQHDVAAAPAGEALVGLLGLLAAGELGLGGVDDDDERAGVDPRGVVGLVLAAEGVGDVDGETADGLLRRVDEDPPAVLAGILGEERVHVFPVCIA